MSAGTIERPPFGDGTHITPAGYAAMRAAENRTDPTAALDPLVLMVRLVADASRIEVSTAAAVLLGTAGVNTVLLQAGSDLVTVEMKPAVELTELQHAMQVANEFSCVQCVTVTSAEPAGPEGVLG